jgi:hypothetical protein
MKEKTEKTNMTDPANAPQLYSMVCGMGLWPACWRMPAISAAMTPMRKAIAVSRMRMVAGWVGDGVVRASPRVSSRSGGRW